MAKRFEDTEKYKKGFVRGMPAAYKILWDYICLDCDHAGVWQVDFEVAQIYVGKDAVVTKDLALGYFNTGEERIQVLNGGSKWFIKPFIDFQYGELNPANRMHLSVISILKREGAYKALTRPLQGAKDKDKDKDTLSPSSSAFMEFWAAYPKKVGKDSAVKAWKSKAPNVQVCLAALAWQVKQEGWVKDGGKYIPNPATWINAGRWADEPVASTYASGAPKVNPADKYLAEQSKVERVEQFHRDHTAGGKCSYCGRVLEKFGICDCPEYLRGWAEIEKEGA